LKIFDEIAEFSADYLRNTPIRALYIRSGKGIMVAPIFYKPTDIINYTMAIVNKFPQIETVLNATFSDRDFVLEKIKFKPVYGTGYIEDTICGLSFKISPKSFYQVNKQGAEELYKKAIELLDARSDQRIADLFCGTGTMGIIVAKNTGATVYGVEIESDAVRDAKENAKINGVKNIHFEAMDAGKFNEKIDACIIDPPRKGCSQFMIGTLLRLKPQKIVYVSCNPDTMCRDIKGLLCEYEISSPIFTYNLFPRTTHVESVVCLTVKRK
jgi:23S rRNA (uracil1939-C5)-methyltransferase